MQNKLFFPQTALDLWIPDGHVELQGAELSLKPEGRTFLVEEGIHVTKEVTTGEDPNGFVGLALAKGAMLEKGAEIYSGSMILGDNAYEVREGWIGAPSDSFAAFKLRSPGASGANDEELLASFLARVPSL